MRIAFTALGLPKPAGSKRPFKRKDGSLGVRDACDQTKSWQWVVASAAREAYYGPGLYEGAISISAYFHFPRPDGHYGKGRNAGKLKPSAPEFKTTAPDSTKLFRAIEDAMEGVVYKNDAQVVEQRVSKHYGEPARVEVIIQTLN